MAPVSFQSADDGSRIAVESRYLIHDDGTVGFALGDYDASRTLVIDPILSWTSYFGGTGTDTAKGIAVDAGGNVYVVGDATLSTSLPTTAGPFGATGAQDSFVAKFSNDGSTLLYSTYFGGGAADTASDIAVDAAGNIYVAGITYSSDFPIVNGADTTLSGSGDAYVLKLNAAGTSITYSTYLGGSGTNGETVDGLALDPTGTGHVVVAGSTDSTNLPTKNAYDTTLGGVYDGFIAAYDTTLSGASSSLYSSYFGGSNGGGGTGNDSIRALVVDSSGNIYLTGHTSATSEFPLTANAFDSSTPSTNDAYVTKLHWNGGTSWSTLYSSFIGSDAVGASEFGEAIAVDGAGKIYVAGSVGSNSFPTKNAYDSSTNGSTDLFLAKFDPIAVTGADSLVYSTFFGGTGLDSVNDIVVDAAGNLYATGSTSSTNLPLSADAHDSTLSGSSDAYLLVLGPSGSTLAYSTYLGGDASDTGYGLALDTDGNTYIAGQTGSNTGLATGGAYDTSYNGSTDGFVAKLLANRLPVATANSYTTTEGVAVSGNVITDNTGAGVDSDPDGDPLTASLVSGPLHGTLSLAANGAFTYTPYDAANGTNFAAADSFIYQLSDGKGGTSSAVVSLTVTPDATNEAPVNSVPGAQVTAQDTTLVFSTANGNRILLRDDSGTNSIQLTVSATNGAVTLASMTGLTVTAGANGTASVTVQGSLTNLNNALNGLAFNPTPAYFGSGSLQVATNDLGKTGAGVPQSDTDVIGITVTEVNYAPIITSNGGGATAGISLPENSLAVTTVTATDANPGDTLTYSISGTDASRFNIDSVTGALTFKTYPDYESPVDADLNNQYLVTVSASDGKGGVDTQAITVTVTQVLDSGTAVWSNATATPQTSAWNGSSFGATSGTVALPSNYRIMQSADAPTRDEKIVVGIDALGNVTGEIWNGSSWSALPLSMGTVSETYWWGADVAYEQLSGDAVAVWNDNTQAAGQKLRYAVWNGSGWSTPQSIASYIGAEPQHLKLAFDPASDAMVLVVDDVNAVDYALLWNGSSWGNAVSLDASGTAEADQTAVAVAFEAQSGRAMVSYGKNNDPNVYYRIWNGTTWGTEASVAAPAGVTGEAKWLVSATDMTSNRIVLGATSASNEAWLSVWNGSSWQASLQAETGTTGGSYPNLAVAYERTTGQALATYGEGTQALFRYRTWDAATGWSTEQTGPTLGGVPNSMTLDSAPASDGIMLSIQDANNDLYYSLWNGGAWGAATKLSTNTGEVKNQPFVFIWNQSGLLVDVNDAPVNTVPATQLTPVNTARIFSAANGNAISVADPDGSSAAVTLTATNGMLTLNGTTGLSFSTGDGSADATMTFSGTLASINAALNGLHFDPTTASRATPECRSAPTTLATPAPAAPRSDVDTVSIEVGTVNHAPVNTVPAHRTSTSTAWCCSRVPPAPRSVSATPTPGSSPVRVTLTGSNGTINLSGTKGLSFTTGDGIDGGDMTFTGTVSDINAALNGMTFVATADFAGTASLQIVTNDLGNTGAGGALSDTDSVSISVSAGRQVDLDRERDDVSSPGATGLTSWTAGQVLNFGPSGGSLLFEPGTTTGTFSLAGFNLDSAGFGDANTQIDALHFVTRNMTAGGIALQKGDLLFSTAGNETLGGVAYEHGDIVLFRPTTPGNYSAGTFSLFFDKTDTGITTTAFTLVEQTVTVGDATLDAGDLLISNNGSVDILRFVPTQLGDTTAGSSSVLIAGANLGFGKDVAAIDVVEQTTVIGNTTLAAGTLIVSLVGEDTTVGSGTQIAVTRFDLFTLDVATTGAGTTSATATLLFQGADVALDNNSEAVQAASLILNQGPTIGNQSFGLPENSANGTVVGTVTGTDPEGGTVKYAITAGNAGGAFAVNAGTGQITVANSAVLDYDTTLVFNLTVAAIDPDGSVRHRHRHSQSEQRQRRAGAGQQRHHDADHHHRGPDHQQRRPGLGDHCQCWRRPHQRRQTRRLSKALRSPGCPTATAPGSTRSTADRPGPPWARSPTLRPCCCARPTGCGSCPTRRMPTRPRSPTAPGTRPAARKAPRSTPAPTAARRPSAPPARRRRSRSPPSTTRRAGQRRAATLHHTEDDTNTWTWFRPSSATPATWTLAP